jgi:membrane protease YdiL (CAAX protease family)
MEESIGRPERQNSFAEEIGGTLCHNERHQSMSRKTRPGGDLMSMDETEPTEQTPDEVFLTAALFEVALGAVALLLGWAVGPSARALVPELISNNVWPILGGIFYGVLAAMPVLLAVELIRRIPWEPIRELERLTDDGMIKALLQLRPAELIVISICAGIGEELLFRGWLMQWLAEGAAGSSVTPAPAAIGVALVVSSIVFGLFHPITRLYVVLATVMGVYFGALLIYTENLLVPISAHATYDAVQLIMTARQERQQEQ